MPKIKFCYGDWRPSDLAQVLTGFLGRAHHGTFAECSPGAYQLGDDNNWMFVVTGPAAGELHARYPAAHDGEIWQALARVMEHFAYLTDVTVEKTSS